MSTDCTFYNPATGAITAVMELSQETLQHYAGTDETFLVLVAGNAESQYVVDGELVDFTPEELAAKRAMPDGWVWRMPERVAVDMRNLAAVKASKNLEINQKRLAANRTSFAFAGKTIACDELSMLDIQSLNGIVTLIGDLPPSFQKQWKAIDNSYVAIPDKATWIGFIGSMVAAGQANFDHAQTLKAALAAATTNADVDDITW